MQTLLGIPYTPPTAEEMQQLVRQAHFERAQVLRRFVAWLFATRGEAGFRRGEHTALRPTG